MSPSARHNVPEVVAIEAAVSRVMVDHLPEGVVLWRVWLDQLVAVNDGLHEWLSPAEQGRAARFYFERDRERFAAGRGVLRWLLGRRLNRHPASVEIAQQPAGKPVLVSAGVTRLFFNLSHSDGLAVYAFSEAGEIGVDVERVRPIPEAESILERHFSADEARRWRGLPREQQSESFLRTWVRYEARVKRSGRGLAQAEEEAGRPGRDVVFEFEPTDGFVGALAI